MDRETYYQHKLTFEADSWDLKVMLNAGEKVIVVDARAPSAYAAEHIPGAINTPHRTRMAESTAALDRSCLIVAYFDSHPTSALAGAAENLEGCGWG